MVGERVAVWGVGWWGVAMGERRIWEGGRVVGERVAIWGVGWWGVEWGMALEDAGGPCEEWGGGEWP